MSALSALNLSLFWWGKMKTHLQQAKAHPGDNQGYSYAAALARAEHECWAAIYQIQTERGHR